MPHVSQDAYYYGINFVFSSSNIYICSWLILIQFLKKQLSIGMKLWNEWHNMAKSVNCLHAVLTKRIKFIVLIIMSAAHPIVLV